MRIDPNFTFAVSLSQESFVNKIIANAMIGRSTDEKNTAIRKEYGFTRGVSYERINVTPTTLLTSLTQGKCACQLFKPQQPRKDGTFGTTDKRYENFEGAYCVFVDVDKTKYQDMRAFIDRLSLKPTFAYTSYSNQQPGKGARFRLCYVFDNMIQGIFHFRYLASKVYEKIERDTNETIKDKCGLSPAQYMNGTNKFADGIIFDEYFSGAVYEYPDFSYNDNDFVEYLKGDCDYSSSTKSKYKRDIDSILSSYNISSISKKERERESKYNTVYDDCKKNEHLLCDMERLSYDEFMREYRIKYEYIYRVEGEEWTPIIAENRYVQYQNIAEGYFSLKYYSTPIKDGQGRRKKLYQRMCLRRVMRPDVMADELLFNAYEDLHRFFDNSGENGANVITIDELQRNVECAMRLRIEDIEKDYSEMLSFLRSKAPKSGRIYKFKGVTTLAERNKAIKAIRWQIISDNYDWTLTPRENYDYLQMIGITVSIDTIYRFCKEYEIPTNVSQKYKDSQMMAQYDDTLSLRANHKKLLALGCKISLGKLCKLRSTHI